MLDILKKTNNEEQKCVFASIVDCPYVSEKDCPSIKVNCHHKNNEIKKIKKDYNKYKIFIIIFFGFILISVGILIKLDYDNFWQDLGFNLLSTLGVSAIASAVISITMDIPAKIKEFEDVIINAYTSNEYLKRLTEAQLKKMRNLITELLHKKDVPNMPKGLIELDQQICDLLNKPYYKVYRETIKCDFVSFLSIEGDPDFIRKDFYIEYTVHNPYDKNHSVSVDLALNKQIYKHEDKAIKDYFTIKEFEISIDDKEVYNLKKNIKIIGGKARQESEFYNTVISLANKNVENITKERLKLTNDKGDDNIVYEVKDEIIREEKRPQLKVVFSDFVKVRFSYTVFVPKEDNHYTKRLRYPVKYFRLDYSCDDPSVQLYGQLLGTLIDQSKISTTISDNGNRLSIETFGWLLPKNGVFVVMGNKLKEGKHLLKEKKNLV